MKFTAPAGCITESLPTVITEFVVKKPKVKNSSLTNNLTINNPVKLSVKKVIGHTYQWYYNDVINLGTKLFKDPFAKNRIPHRNLNRWQYFNELSGCIA